MIKFLRNNSIYLNLLILILMVGVVLFLIKGYTLYQIINSINETIIISDVFKFIDGNWIDNMFIKYDGTIILKNQVASIQSIPIIIILLIDYIFTIAILFIPFVLYFIKSHSKIHDNHLKDSVNYASIIRDQHAQLLAENISHEISTPISVIESYIAFNHTQLSRTCVFNCKTNQNNVCSNITKYSQYMDEIQKNIDVIKTVLDRLSNYKTVKYGKNVSLYELFEFCRNSLSISKLYNFKITIDNDLALYTSSTIYSADLISIITNMMKNSVEAGATDITILCDYHDKFSGKYEEKNDFVICTFLDNGSGIQNKDGSILSPKDYNNIFKPYFSVKNKLTEVNNLISSDDGLLSATRGIGLFFTKSIIEEHGGWIKVLSSSIDEGTVFAFKIYVSKLEEAKNEILSDNTD